RPWRARFGRRVGQRTKRHVRPALARRAQLRRSAVATRLELGPAACAHRPRVGATTDRRAHPRSAAARTGRTCARQRHECFRQRTDYRQSFELGAMTMRRAILLFSTGFAISAGVTFALLFADTAHDAAAPRTDPVIEALPAAAAPATGGDAGRSPYVAAYR